MVLGALAALLGLEDDIEVCAQAQDGAEAFRVVRELQPDVLLTDIEMPGLTGLELAEAVKQELPAVRVVILTTFARPGYLQRALGAGAAGYLLKDAPATELADALRRVHAGGRAVAPELALEAWGESDPLTERERQVLRRAALGLTSSEIAGELGLSDGTVRNYLSEAISKLGAVNRIDAARRARENGWL